MKQYNFNGLAGCVVQRKAHDTKTLVGVYNAEQSGIDCDPENPWITLCEEHSYLVSHPTLKLAIANSADPKGWCPLCYRE